ncbi:DUF6191 domain-containing protein [Streptomyces sp. bgisy159]|uniref:DUF6191 domain-containing protein n=1 Tax=Streptomyces sp. bgisy159 TaxID=3413795 RepID=UPI003F4A39D5
MFNALEELFAPGRRHTRDERKRLELSREDVGDNDPGRGPVDLDSGKVVVRLRKRAPADGEADPRATPGADPGGAAPGGGEADGDATGGDGADALGQAGARQAARGPDGAGDRR